MMREQQRKEPPPQQQQRQYPQGVRAGSRGRMAQPAATAYSPPLARSPFVELLAPRLLPAGLHSGGVAGGPAALPGPPPPAAPGPLLLWRILVLAVVCTAGTAGTAGASWHEEGW